MVSPPQLDDVVGLDGVRLRDLIPVRVVPMARVCLVLAAVARLFRAD
ncbi:hypothetical protein [Deefgea sp. CFH1-16]|nr:hypothetical protein [Deefgea sp. CFH1-16]MBM5573747.1 hypothetical protein [Deefgea sp. CFH1-16]